MLALPLASSVAADEAASPACVPRSAPVPTGPATLVGEQPVENTDGRLRDVTLEAPALYGRTHAYVLLPKDYDPSGDTRYPVLYLLHGALSNYGQWHREGGVVGLVDEVTRSAQLPPFIVVMPDGGSWGFYSDWYGSDLDSQTQDPPPAWTQYHMNELIPFIDGHYPTIAARTGRAIAGLSMGGFGAMSYAARYPDRFSSAGSFSGAVNPDLAYPYGNAFLTAASLYFNQGHVAQCVWGDMVTQRVRWEGHDPTVLAPNLGSTSLFIASGGGDAEAPAGMLPNPDDALDPVAVAGHPVEETVFLMSKAFTRALDSAHIPHTDDFYGSGAHAMKYWAADLRRFLPLMARAWEHPPAAPPEQPFSYRSIQSRFSAWDWHFTTHRSGTAFTDLSEVARRGLVMSGSGAVDVTTAPLYRKRKTYRITDRGMSRTVVAGADRRLRFTIDLGSAAGTRVHVAISRS